MHLLKSSSGVTKSCTFSQYSANDMASFALVAEFLDSHFCQSGHRPGATESTNAPNAMPLCQSDVKFEIDNVGILFCIHTKSLELSKLFLSVQKSFQFSIVGCNVNYLLCGV